MAHSFNQKGRGHSTVKVRENIWKRGFVMKKTKKIVALVLSAYVVGSIADYSVGIGC